MKKITVACPVVLNASGASHRFLPGATYEVEASVAEHPYLARFIATCAEVPRPKKSGGKKKEPAPEEPTQAEEADDGHSDA